MRKASFSPGNASRKRASAAVGSQGLTAPVSLIRWDQSFSVNVAEIDQQHRHMIDLYNKLYAAMMQQKGNQILGGILDALANYAEKHFSLEERYFHKIKYSGTRGHILEHRAFVQRLGELRTKDQAGKAFLTVETLAFLRDWLEEHIKGTDKQYSAEFNASGII